MLVSLYVPPYEIITFITNLNLHLLQLTLCSELTQFVSGSKVDAVVDFSGFDPEAVEEALRVVWRNVGVYIYVSSDSVYEVGSA